MPADVPIDVSDRTISYSPGAGTANLDIDFPFQQDEDIRITRTRAAVNLTLTLGVDYTLEGAGLAVGGGNVIRAVLSPTSQAGDVYVIDGNVQLERPTDFQQSSWWPAGDVNYDLDRIWMALQEFNRDLARAQVSPASLPLSTLNGGSGGSYASVAALFAGIKQDATASVTGVVTNQVGRGVIGGLTLANNAGDATNDIDIAAGAAMASDQSAMLVLSGALTKRLDATWAVGTNQGMRASGAAIADTTYHIFLIRRPDTGVVDIAADTSATGANIPANTNAAYTQRRRIGSIIRAGGAIVAFTQNGDIFNRAAATDRNSTAAAAAALLTTSVPLGIQVQPLFLINLNVGVSVDCQIRLGNASAGAAATTVCRLITGAGDTTDNFTSLVQPMFTTNTSAQVFFEQLNNTGTPASSQLITFGWIDTRGRND